MTEKARYRSYPFRHFSGVEEDSVIRYADVGDSIGSTNLVTDYAAINITAILVPVAAGAPKLLNCLSEFWSTITCLILHQCLDLVQRSSSTSYTLFAQDYHQWMDL